MNVRDSGLELPPGYRLVPGSPDVDSYLHLRASAGLTPRTRELAIAGLPGSWAAVHVLREPSGVTVGMGRAIGDGGLNFEIVDMAVLPEHQRLGLGDAILSFLLDRIREAAPVGAFVSLLADPLGSGPVRKARFSRDGSGVTRNGDGSRLGARHAKMSTGWRSTTNDPGANTRSSTIGQITRSSAWS